MLTGDKRFNPLASHPFPLFNAHRQCERYTSKELVAAMESLLEANRKLVTTDQEEAVVLQQTLIQIVGIQAKSTRANPAH
jgi:DNA polymerase III delta subunit